MTDGFDSCKRRAFVMPPHSPKVLDPRCYIFSGDRHTVRGGRDKVGRLVIPAMTLVLSRDKCHAAYTLRNGNPVFCIANAEESARDSLA
jgi:hypothetical protein